MQLDINKIIEQGIHNELDHEQAMLAERKLRILSEKDSLCKAVRKHLRDLIEEWESEHWSAESEISDEQIRESDEAERIIESEFFDNWESGHWLDDDTLEVKIVNKSTNELPKYATEGSAGMDLKAFLYNPEILNPMERKMIPTGIYIQLPKGYEAQIRPRSGLAIKNGISIINTPGTIDSDYTGEVCILLVNLSDDTFVVRNGDRIAQMIINKYETCRWNLVEELDETIRGIGGFGHTGK